MLIEPAGLPRLRFDVEGVSGERVLLRAWNLDTGEDWAGEDPTAVAMWAALEGRNAVFLASLPCVSAWPTFERQDRDGAVVILVPVSRVAVRAAELAAFMPIQTAEGLIRVEPNG